MSDDKNEVGKPDRIRVSSTERYEVDYLAEKFELPAATVEQAIKEVGPMREAVEKRLKEIKEGA